MTGRFVDVRTSATAAWLRPRFITLAKQLGFADFDQAAIKGSEPRTLTQAIAGFVYGLADTDGVPVADGVRFASRHGDELILWAIFERPGDEPSSSHITPSKPPPSTPTTPNSAKP